MTVIVSGCCPEEHHMDSADVQLVPASGGYRVVSCPIELAKLKAAA